MEIKTQARKWGNSIAIILPKSVAEENKIKVNDTITLEIKKRPLAGDLFGKFPGWNKPTQKIKDEMKEGWS